MRTRIRGGIPASGSRSARYRWASQSAGLLAGVFAAGLHDEYRDAADPSGLAWVSVHQAPNTAGGALRLLPDFTCTTT